MSLTPFCSSSAGVRKYGNEASSLAKSLLSVLDESAKSMNLQFISKLKFALTILKIAFDVGIYSAHY